MTDALWGTIGRMEQLARRIEFELTFEDRIRACELLLERPEFQRTIGQVRKLSARNAAVYLLIMPVTMVGMVAVYSFWGGNQMDELDFWVAFLGGWRWRSG